MRAKIWLFAILGLVLALAPAAIVLAVMPPRMAPAGALGGPATPGTFDGEATCAEWSDGCVVCQRQAAGPPACSMPGIACIRAAPRCLRRDGT